MRPYIFGLVNKRWLLSAKSRKAARVAKAQTEQAETMAQMEKRMNAIEAKLDVLLAALSPQKEETGDSKQADEKMATAEAQVEEQFAEVDEATASKRKR